MLGCRVCSWVARKHLGPKQKPKLSTMWVLRKRDPNDQSPAEAKELLASALIAAEEK